MKINVKEVGIGTPVNPNLYNPYDANWIEFEANAKDLPALDTNGNKLPIGEYEVELVWQFKSPKVQTWHKAESQEACAKFEDFAICFNGRGYETRKVYIASVAPTEYSVNGIPVTEKQFNDSIYTSNKYASNFRDEIGAPESNIRHTDMTGVPLSPVDGYYKELGNRMMDEAKVKKMPRRYWWCRECQCEVDNPSVTLEETHKNCGTDLNWCIEPKREVNTIEQAADKHYHSFDESKFDETPTVQQCFTAGANYKSSNIPIVTGQNYEEVKAAVTESEKSIYEAHGIEYPKLVPIEEVIKILFENRKCFSHSKEYDTVISKINQLIKPQ